MGRYSTGAITTREMMRFELSYFVQKKILKPGIHASGTMAWNNGSTIGYEVNFTAGNRYIRLDYKNESLITGEINHLDYKIHLASIPSNLGNGQVWYFLCPESGQKARILYKCYGSLIFKSRKAYRKRIYYAGQAVSKYDYHNTMYWQLQSKIDELNQKATKSHYRGQRTKLQQRIHKLDAKTKYHDEMRFAILEHRLIRNNPEAK